MSKAQIIEGIMKKVGKTLRVAMPASIVSYDHKYQKASVQIDIQQYLDGESLEYPIISNVPVIFAASGGASFSMPVKNGDRCLVLFMDQDINSWRLGGDNIAPESERSHHLSDAVAIVGLNNLVTESKSENNDDVLLSYSGSNIRLKPEGKIDIHSANEVNVKTKDVIINCTNATVNSEEKIDITCKEANLKASSDINIECNNANVTAAKNIVSKSDVTNIQANTNVNVECQSATIKASSDIATETPNFVQTGTFKVDGNVEITGNSEMQGRLTVDGRSEFKKKLTCDKTIEGNKVKTSSGIDLDNHKHSYSKPVVGSNPTAATPATTGAAQ